jgi:hypothetical protein
VLTSTADKIGRNALGLAPVETVDLGSSAKVAADIMTDLRISMPLRRRRQ